MSNCGEKVTIMVGTPKRSWPVVVVTQCGSPSDFSYEEWKNATECLNCKRKKDNKDD